MRFEDFDVPMFAAYQSMLRGGVPRSVVADMVAKHEDALGCLQPGDASPQAEIDQARQLCRTYHAFLSRTR